MNIAFDAKRAFLNDTGLGNYSRTLISSLAALYPQHLYYLYTTKTGSLFKPNADNIRIQLPEKPFQKMFKSAWRSSGVVSDLQNQHIHLYHGLSHEIPQGIQRTKIKSVVTMHDLIHERYPSQYPWLDRKIYTRKFRFACHNADAVIAISEQTKKDLIEFYGTDATKIHVCYQSCDPRFTKVSSNETKNLVRRKYNLPDEYLLYVGSIIERKNLLNICKALRSAKDVDVPLVVVGKGKDYYEQVKQFLKDNNMEGKVIFLSYYRQDNGNTGIDFIDLPAIYQMSHMLIYPSFFEGFGIPVLEGLNSRIPVITSNTSCLPEAGGDAAFYVDPGQPEDIAEKIRLVLRDDELVSKHIANGVAYAQQFTNEKAAEAVHQVYQSLF
jgi:glycosyltransferase involved in cell wall biosynthesis